MSTATGNPFARQSAALRQALLDAVTAEDLAAVARALIAKAAGGDVAAARLVLSYVLGKPTPAVDPDRLDADEWQGYRETAGMMTELPQVLQAPEPELPLQTVRGARPTLTRELGQQLGAMLAEPEKYQPEVPDLEWVEEDGPAKDERSRQENGRARLLPSRGKESRATAGGRSPAGGARGPAGASPSQPERIPDGGRFTVPCPGPSRRGGGP